MSNAIDLTGVEVGKLLVLEKLDRKRKGKTLWLCKCECCGKTCERITSQLTEALKKGYMSTCGCCRPGRREDLTGQRFGKLIAIEVDQELTKERNGQGRSGAYWKCKCDCGNTISVRIADLKNGSTQSCGCSRKETCAKVMREVVQPRSAEAKVIDLVGQVFGKLTVLERVPNTSPIRWKCRCECGNITEVNGNSLRRGVTQSCGCLGNSLGNDRINQLLLDNNINFKREVSFNDLKDESYLRYDFGLYNENNELIKLIEYDGRQHSDATSIWHTDKVILHDNMKTQYAKDHGIPFLRISYKDYNRLDIDYLLNKVSP